MLQSLKGGALNSAGEATTDPAEALRGTVQTMAGHKEYALALMVEAFSGVLSGAAVGPEIGSMYKDLDRKQDVGHFFACSISPLSYLRNSSRSACGR
jgi:LDH2 family malate/lactate/ureidoglycolate dehydrogenase